MSEFADRHQIMKEILEVAGSDWATAIGTRIKDELPKSFKNGSTYCTIVPSPEVPIGESDAWKTSWTVTLYGGTVSGKDAFILYRKFAERFHGIKGEKVTTGKIITSKILSVDRTPDPVKDWPRVIVICETVMALPSKE